MSSPISLQQLLSSPASPPRGIRPVAAADATNAQGGLAKHLEQLAAEQEQRSQEHLWRALFGDYQNDPKANTESTIGRAQADSSKQNAARAKYLRGTK